MSVLQRLEQHDGGRHRKREAEDDARPDRPAEQRRKPDAHDGGTGDLHHGAGDGDGTNAQQILEREMEADAEHQQDHAELGELARKLGIGDNAGGERTRRDAGQQIANQRRHPEAIGDSAENECQHQTRHDRCDQGCIVRHQ